MAVPFDLWSREVRRAVWALIHAPVFATVVVLTLALGIGVNATVLGIVDKLYFRSLPVPSPKQIVAVYTTDTPGARGGGSSAGWSSMPDFAEVQRHARGVRGLAAYSMTDVAVADPVNAETWTALVTGNYFAVLGVGAQLGRLIAKSDAMQRGASPVVVISDYLWRTRFSRDEHVVGQLLRISHTDFTIIGVAPRDFTGTHPEGRTDLWLPYTMQAEATGHPYNFDRESTRNVMIIGRLRAGAALTELQASLVVAARDLHASGLPGSKVLAFTARIRDRLLDYRENPEALMMMTMVWILVMLVTLVAGSNVSGLMLARLAASRRALGIRLCLGASRRDVMLQSALEALVLFVPGTVLGLFITRWFTISVTSARFLSALDSGMNLRVVVIVCAVAALTVFQFVLVPALEASRLNPVELVREGQVASERRKWSGSRTIVLGQLTIAMMLLVNTLAFSDLLLRQQNTQLGFVPDSLLVVDLAPRASAGGTANAQRLYFDALARIAATPGVTNVAAAIGAPLYANHWLGTVTTGSLEPNARPRQVSLQAIGPAYFATLGVHLLAGREFTDDDRRTSAKGKDRFSVAIVNTALAKRLWPGANAMGQLLQLNGQAPSRVVGIVPDLADASINGAVPRAYFPLLETDFTTFSVLVRGSDPATLTAAVQASLRDVSTISRPTMRSLASIVSDARVISESAVAGLSVCAGVTMALAAVGLFGVVSTWATQRKRELGIRIAIGAGAAQVFWMMVRQAAELVATGVILGGICGLGLVQIERASIGPSLTLSPFPVVISGIALSIVALLAIMIPAYRAVCIHPAIILRNS